MSEYILETRDLVMQFGGLIAVKGGSPGNAQRLTSERGAPVRRR